MQARLTAYPPDTAAVTRWVAPAERLRIGRGHDCGLVIEHGSVSRAHAEFYFDGGWRLRDLGSKNGSFADGMPVQDSRLEEHCWLRFGDAHCELTVFEDAQAALIRERERDRRTRTEAMTRQVASQAHFDVLLDDVLRGVVELSGCDRGFLLLADGDDFAVCARMERDAPAGQRDFPGSVGAVQRTLDTHVAVVVNRIADEAWLARRASIVDSGLHSLVCLPLLDGRRVVGAVYADRCGAGEPITQVDLELLQAFAESATLWLLARRALTRLDAAPRWSTIVASAAVPATPVGVAP